MFPVPMSESVHTIKVHLQTKQTNNLIQSILTLYMYIKAQDYTSLVT